MRGDDVVVRVVREEGATSPGARFSVEVSGPGHCATVRTFEEADTDRAERLARACAIRLATSLHCPIATA